MMSDNNYPDSGILFRNRERTSDRSPDYSGDGNANCPQCGAVFNFKLSGWVKTAKNGARFLTLSLRTVEKGPQDKKATNQSADDDIPF